MAKSILLLFLLTVSLRLAAFECFEVDKFEGTIEKNFELASDVIFGKVLRGNASDSKVDFIFDISYALKGSKLGKLKLSTGSGVIYPQVALGGDYLLFLYSQDEIGMCDPIYEMPYPIGSYVDFEEFVLRKDLLLAKELEKLLGK